MNFDSASGKKLKFPAELCPHLLCIFVELDYLGKLSEAKMTLRAPPPRFETSAEMINLHAKADRKIERLTLLPAPLRCPERSRRYPLLGLQPVGHGDADPALLVRR